MYIYDVEYVQGGQGGPLHVNFHYNGRVGGFGAEPCSSKPPPVNILLPCDGGNPNWWRKLFE